MLLRALANALDAALFSVLSFLPPPWQREANNNCGHTEGTLVCCTAARPGGIFLGMASVFVADILAGFLESLV